MSDNPPSLRVKRKPQSSPASILKNTTPNYIIDKVAYVIMAMAFIYLSWIIVQYSQSSDAGLNDLANKGMIAIILALTGMVFMFSLISATEDRREKKFTVSIRGYEEEDLRLTLLTAVIGMLAISIMNFILFRTLTFNSFSVTGFDLYLFPIAMAIVEEVLFSMLFQITFEELSNSWIIGVIVRGFGFMFYHWAVYGQNPQFLLSTLFGGIVLGLTLHYSKRLTTNIVIHVGINALSTGFSFSV